MTLEDHKIFLYNLLFQTSAIIVLELIYFGLSEDGKNGFENFLIFNLSRMLKVDIFLVIYMPIKVLSTTYKEFPELWHLVETGQRHNKYLLRTTNEGIIEPRRYVLNLQNSDQNIEQPFFHNEIPSVEVH